MNTSTADRRRIRCHRLLIFVAVTTWLAGTAAQAATRVGEATLTRGLVSAAGEESTARLIGSGSAIFQGDVISTGPRSAAVLKLADDSRITLRPNSSFKVESFSVEPSKPSAVMRLFKGGMRAVTGFISKRDPNAMRLRTAVATIGIRGTEFDVRVCGADCVDEAKARPAASGRVGFAKGSIVAYAQTGGARALATGKPLFSGERVVTSADSYAVLVFRDASRVTVLPNTEFQVERFEFDEEKPSVGRSIFRLVRGGLRAVTGAIGKTRRGRYQMKTPVATIGIRGTGYDLVCQGTCVNPGGAVDPAGDGMFADVNDGAIDFDGGPPIPAGTTVFMGDPGSAPVTVPGLPVPIPEPAPNTVSVTLPPPSPPPVQGLYVSCFVGNCSVQTDQNTVELSNGGASFVGDDGATELPEIPAFQAEDPVYQAMNVGGSVDALDQFLDGGGSECAVP